MSADLAALFADPRRGLFASIAGLRPCDAAAVRRHAHREESRGAYTDACEAYRAAIALSPEDTSSWRGLARCLRRTGDERASSALERAASLLAERPR